MVGRFQFVAVVIVEFEALAFEAKHHIFVDVEGHFGFSGNVGGNVFDRTLLLDVLKRPPVNVFVDLVCSVESDDLFGGVLVAVNLLRVDIDAEIDEEGLIVFMDGLVAFRVGSLNRFHDFWIIYDAVVDVKE